MWQINFSGVRKSKTISVQADGVPSPNNYKSICLRCNYATEQGQICSILLQ